MKPGRNDIILQVLISGLQLSELKRHTWQMTEAFGLDEKIENHQGKRPLGLYRWDMDCLIDVIEMALDDSTGYPDKKVSGYTALKNLLGRLRNEYRKYD
jgi:hypothetical protein